MGKSSPSRGEIEAQEVSLAAQVQIRESLNWANMALLAVQWFRRK
jgi:hypothetical protein